MMSLIIVLGAILILGVLYMIFRVTNLVTIAKGVKDDKVGPNNSLHGVLFIIFMVASLVAFFWYSFAHFEGYTLPIASVHGKQTDHLFWVTMAVTVAAFVI